MAKAKSKPISQGSRQNKRPSSHNNSNIFVILWEIIKLLSKKCARKIKRLYIKTVKSSNSLFKNTDFSLFSNYKIIISAISIVALIALTVLLIWGFTNKNAYEISIGENPVGFIKVNKNVTNESLSSAVTTIISNNLGMKIKLAEAITIKNVHSPKKKIETEDALLSKLTSSVEYQVEAVSVTLEGVEVALLKNDEEFNAVKERLVAPYVNDNSVVVESGFVENLATSKKFTDSSEITDADKAYERLSAKYETEILYTIKSGDVMGAIATNNGTTVEAICVLNGIPVQDAHKLKIGQQLKLKAEKPILSVKTIEEIKYTEVVEYESVTQLSPGSSGSRVVQEGKNGQSEVTAHVEKINGLEQSREIVNRATLIPPVNEIIEIGSN